MQRVLLLGAAMFFFTWFAFGQGFENWEFCGVQFIDSNETVVGRPSLTGPVEYILTSGFRVHYTRSGVDSVPTTYAQSVANWAQASRNVLCDQFGWRIPPSDGTVGGDSRYDIYIRLLDSLGRDLGVTFPESLKIAPNGFSSYIILNSIITDAGLRHFTVDHEFNHASQYAYSKEDVQNNWFAENTASCMPQYIDPANRSVFITRLLNPAVSGPLQSSFLKLREVNGYAGGLWPLFLAEWLSDSTVIRNIWEQFATTAGRHTLDDIAYVLNGRGKTLTEALRQYALWRYFTAPPSIGGRADTYHFRDAYQYLGVLLRELQNYPIDSTVSITPNDLRPRGGGGVRFFDFLPQGNSVTITFDGDSSHSMWSVFLLSYRNPQPYLFSKGIDKRRVPVYILLGLFIPSSECAL